MLSLYDLRISKEGIKFNHNLLVTDCVNQFYFEGYPFPYLSRKTKLNVVPLSIIIIHSRN